MMTKEEKQRREGSRDKKERRKKDIVKPQMASLRILGCRGSWQTPFQPSSNRYRTTTKIDSLSLRPKLRLCFGFGFGFGYYEVNVQ